MPRLWKALAVAHVHGCLLQDFFFFFQQDVVQRKAKGRVVQPCRAAKTGIGRDAEQQDQTRHLVVMG